MRPIARVHQVDALWLAGTGLLTQAFWALQLRHPSYMDAYYYATNGMRLASGHGFTEEVVWQFLDRPSALPIPSHTYWMPLTSLLTASGYKMLEHFRGAQAPFWILAGLLPLLSYAIAWQLGRQRWQAVTAALLTASGGFYNRFFGQPATFAPFAWAGGVCILALALSSRPGASWRLWLLAGLSAGLAHLTRADGMLLFFVAALTWLLMWGERRGRERPAPGSTHRAVRSAAGLVAGYFTIMGGWFARNWIAVGRPLPTAGTQSIFLTTYDDLFAYGRTFDMSHLLAWGWGNILQSRLVGLSLAGQTFLAVGCLIFLLPLILWAWWSCGRRQWGFMRPMTLYALTLYGAMSLVFTLPGGRGGLFHSSAALWPWLMALAAIGLGLAVDWTALRLSHWRPDRAKRVFAALAVVVAFGLSFAVGLQRQPDQAEAIIYQQIGDTLPETAVVMVGNAPGFYYHTGLPAVSIPNEPVPTMLEAASHFGVDYLVLDENRPLPLAPLYRGEAQSPQIRLLERFGQVSLYRITDS